MDSGFYAAMAGLVARTQALDSAAANLANAQTPGYRAEREYFRSVLLGPDTLDSQLGRTVNNFGLLGGNRLDLGQGALTTTGNALDLAIEGEGFFEIQTKSGSRFTRDGGFHRTSTGDLVTVKGEPVLSDSGKPIQLPPGEVSVGADGAELVGDAKDDAGGVGSVSAEEVVVRKESKFGVDAAAGKGFGDDLFSVDESVDAQIAPSCAVAAQIENEGRVFEMGELFAVCIGFRD